ncbi:MAG: hypothetical protein EXS14_09535 [Planctomycetes bacterium]|nr:hypothetical protein [Planctomycetota bacterium]
MSYPTRERGLKGCANSVPRRCAILLQQARVSRKELAAFWGYGVGDPDSKHVTDFYDMHRA